MEKMPTKSLETQGADCNHSGSHESVADTGHQFQIQGPLVQTTPRTDSSSTLPIEPGTAAMVIQQSHSLASVSEEDCSSQSTSAGNNHLVSLRSELAVVQQENHPPAAAIRPNPGYNLSDTCGRHIVTDSLVPSRTQMITRNAQPPVAYTQTTFVHMGCCLRVITRENIGHTALEYGPFRNRRNARRYRYISFQRPPTLGDTLGVTQGELSFSLHNTHMSQELQIFYLSALHPRCRGIMSPDSKFIYSGWISTGMQKLAYSQRWVEAPFSRDNIHCRCGAGRDCHRCCKIIPHCASKAERTASVYRQTQENTCNRRSATTNTNSKVSVPSRSASDPWLVISNFLIMLSSQPGLSHAVDDQASAHSGMGPSGEWGNTSNRDSDTRNTNNQVSVASRSASGSWLEISNLLRMSSSQPGVSQAAGGPTSAHGGSGPSGGKAEERRVEQAGQHSGSRRHADAHQQGLGAGRSTAEACRGGQRRHPPPSESSAPAAKKRHMDRL